MVKHRLWSTVLFLGFATYLFLCIGVQIILFKQYAASFQGIAHINLIPFASVLGAMNIGTNELQMPVLIWIQLALSMIPAGFVLFLWVEDCTSFRSIAAITLGFSGILCAANYLLIAPVLDIEFVVASLFGAFIGYGIAIMFVELLFAKRIQPMLATSPKTSRKAA